MKYKLVDGVQRNADHPLTFQIPTKLEKALIEPEMMVKVCIEGGQVEGANGERFWLIVTEYKWSEITQTGAGKGTVNNDLVLFPELNETSIDFSCKHVLDILE